MDDKEFEIVTNQKGNLALLRSGYRYTKNVTNKGGTTLWRCVRRSICNASVTTNKNNEKLLRESLHTCQPDHLDNEVLKEKQILKEAVCKNLGPIQKIIEKRNRDNIKGQDLGISYRSCKDSLRRARKKYLGTDILAHSNPESITIPEALGSEFLIHQDYEILLFATNVSKKIVKRPGKYYADGTFKTTPKPYYQLFTIHCDIGSSEEQTNIIPVAFALLMNKTQVVYEKLFYILKDKLRVQMLTFKSDYETAILNAASKVFPSAQISGCYHHYNDAVWRMSKKLKLNKTKEGRSSTRKCAIIPLVPANRIHQTWQHILDTAPDTREMRKFRVYFENTWYPNQSASTISVAKQRHRTTNSLEGWHHRLNKRIPKKPNLYLFIHKLRQEANHWDRKITNALFKSPLLKNRRKQCDIDFDRRYRCYLKKLERNLITIPTFLQKIIFLQVSLKK